jgi:hypothetical protein
MVWENIKDRFNNNHIIKSIKTHWLYWLDAASLGALMSNLISTPTINAALLILVVIATLIIIIDHITKSKTYRCIAYIAVLIVCIPSVIIWWNNLVYILDRDNPYKQPLLTGNATIEVIISSDDKSIGTNYFNSWCYSGRVSLGTEQELLLEMWVATVPGIHIERIENNRLRYSGELALHPNNKTTGKPIKYLTKAESAVILINEHLPPDSNVISGKAILTLNSSVRIEIPIPSQIMDGNNIIIQEIQKYLTKGN